MKKFFLLLFSSILFLSTKIIAQVNLQETNLPIVLIETNGREIVDEPKIFATLKIIDNGPGNINNVADTPNDYSGFAGIELRGQSSLYVFDKKSYGIELKTEINEDTSVSILGMPKEEDWVLHGPYSDKTLLRNFLSFHIWSQMDRYGSRTRLCEVVINGDYKGVFVFMEKIKRDGDRVDISKLNPDENSEDDLTGGYIVKIDKTNPGEFIKGWNSPYKPPFHINEEQNIFFQIEYPKPENITGEQADYIQSYIEAFEHSLANPGFTNIITGYRAFADVESFIDYAILTELNKNIDGYRLSTFMYKNKDSKGGKLKLGPPWDYNLAYGNADYCDGANIQGWAWDFNKICPADYWLIPFWWHRILEDPNYVDSFKSRWQNLRSGPLATNEILHFIDSVSLVLEEPQQRNFQRWPVLGEYVWPNSFVGATYQDEINYLKTWIQSRMNWMDSAIGSMEVVLASRETMGSGLILFPNPTSDEIHVESLKAISSYQVLDLQGRLLLKKDFHPLKSFRIDISKLTSGTYILEAASGTELFKQVIIKDDVTHRN